jgi:hypothetical protein
MRIFGSPLWIALLRARSPTSRWFLRTTRLVAFITTAIRVTYPSNFIQLWRTAVLFLGFGSIRGRNLLVSAYRDARLTHRPLIVGVSGGIYFACAAVVVFVLGRRRRLQGKKIGIVSPPMTSEKLVAISQWV